MADEAVGVKLVKAEDMAVVVEAMAEATAVESIKQKKC